MTKQTGIRAHTDTHTHTYSMSATPLMVTTETDFSLLSAATLSPELSIKQLLLCHVTCLSVLTVLQSYSATTTQEYFYKLTNITMKSRAVNLHPDIDFLLSLHKCIYNGYGDVMLQMALGGRGGGRGGLNTCPYGWSQEKTSCPDEKIK